jgi:hypothetical protein
MTIEQFAAQVQESQATTLKARHDTSGHADGGAQFIANFSATTIKSGKKYSKVDVGSSGRFMVVNETGEIFGIKAYGVINRGHRYGTLENPADRAFRW